MRSRVPASQRLLSSLLVLFVLWQPTWSAIVAQERVKEMVQQARQLVNASLSEDEPKLFEVEGEKGTSELAQPLSLQITVLEETVALGREMSMPKWQAMVLALGGDRHILKRFAQLRPHFAALEGVLRQSQVGGLEEQLDQLAALNTSTTWTRIWPQLQTLIENVAELHDWFDRYQRNAAVVNESILRTFAETVLKKDGLTIRKILDSIHEQVCPPIIIEDGFVDQIESDQSYNSSVPCDGGLLKTLDETLKQAPDSFICSLPTSPHKLVYDLYSLVALTDAKGYAIMQFSWMLLGFYGRGSSSENYVAEANEARTAFESRVLEKAEAAQNILSQVTTWHWKCDTPAASDQLENETFVQFNELLQGYVVNEVDLNQDASCQKTCPDYTNGQEKGCFDTRYCAQSRRCSGGRIYNCQYIEADSNICTSTSQGRRYDWIKYKSGRMLGQKSECNAPNNKNLKVNSWWRGLYHCSYCMCLCDQPGRQSDRYVSLQSALAATSSNHLITGVRFTKKNRIVHIQIQEGEALPRGLVNESTLSWQPLTNLTILKTQERSIEDGLGYATLSYQERAIDLDDLQAPKGHVITGLRFRKLGGHLNLEAQVSPIEFSTGIIDAERAIWISNDNTPAAETNPRTKLSLLSPDISTRSSNQSVPDSSSDQFIEFQASSLDKDVSQNMVPFIETLPVSAEPPSWLTGIGVYHKGQPGYGGFVAFRIATINYTDYVKVPSKTFSSTPEEDITV